MKQKLLLKRFHFNGHTVKFYLQTQKLEPPHKYTILVSDVLKFILGCEAWGNKTKEVIVRLSGIDLLHHIDDDLRVFTESELFCLFFRCCQNAIALCST